MSDAEQKVQEASESILFAEFLESSPPSSVVHVSDVATPQYMQGTSVCVGYNLSVPEIRLHCPSDTCGGVRFFRRTTKNLPSLDKEEYKFFFLSFVCSNCRATEKTFALAVSCDDSQPSGSCYKFGELPEFGPPTPSRLIKLIGPDREIFLKGRRCENQGLGIGAFVYYRRVVENQKNRILAEIIKVSEKIGAAPELTEKLRQAQSESQFSKALTDVKDAIPQALLLNGHNPMSLLHSALSEGLHAQTDEACLELAHSIRVVLAELSDRLGQALKDEAELNRALGALMRGKPGG